MYRYQSLFFINLTKRQCECLTLFGVMNMIIYSFSVQMVSKRIMLIRVILTKNMFVIFIFYF